MPKFLEGMLTVCTSADLGDHNGLSMTWKVNLAAGTKVMLSLEDGSSDEAWSGDVSSVQRRSIPSER